jgi:signal peptidase I
MSDLKTSLERVAEAGVTGIALLPVHEVRAQRRARARNAVAAMAGMCIVLVAVALAVAVSLRSPEQHRQQPLGEPKLVANASYDVPSSGMSPTLQIGDVVSGTTNFGAIERGDVVRVRFPLSPEAPAVPPGGGAGFKRVVGLPGDAIEGRNDHVFVNGRELTQPYITSATSDFPRVVVPGDSYFLLGDNRPNSTDSRQWGSVRRSEIIAIALRITAPAERAGAIAGSPR